MAANYANQACSSNDKKFLKFIDPMQKCLSKDEFRRFILWCDNNAGPCDSVGDLIDKLKSQGNKCLRQGLLLEWLWRLYSCKSMLIDEITPYFASRLLMALAAGIKYGTVLRFISYKFWRVNYFFKIQISDHHLKPLAIRDLFRAIGVFDEPSYKMLGLKIIDYSLSLNASRQGLRGIELRTREEKNPNNKDNNANNANHKDKHSYGEPSP